MKIKTLSLSLLLALCLTLSMSTAVLAETAVSLYTNQGLKVQMEVPQGWHHESSEAITQRSLERARAIAAKAMGMSEEEVTQIESTGSTKEVLIKMNLEGSTLPVVQVIYEDISAKPNVQSELVELERFMNFITQMTYLDVISPPSETMVNGATAAHVSYQMEVVLEGQDFSTQSDVYYFLKGNQSVVITAMRDVNSPQPENDETAIQQIINSFKI